jgi:hypothetical protein
MRWRTVIICKAVRRIFWRGFDRSGLLSRAMLPPDVIELCRTKMQILSAPRVCGVFIGG